MKRFLDYLAGSFLRHLDFELSRSESLLDTIVVGDKTPREWTLPVREGLLELFPHLHSTPPHPRNFVEELCIRNGRDTYHNSTFEVLNVVFFEAIRNLYEQTPESRKRHREATFSLMRLFDNEKSSFSIQAMLRSQANLRELLREMVNEVYPDEDVRQRVWKIVYQQNMEHMTWMIEHFESILAAAWEKSEQLLHNILPKSICEELKQNQKIIPSHIECGSVLFTDFIGFTKQTEKMAPSRLIEELDICFSRFDQIIQHLGLEKIKTLGDGYMCAGGVPHGSMTHPYDICLTALQMREGIRDLARERQSIFDEYWRIRIGIHVGPLVAGVIGEHKFSYDIWGDTVNIASRMVSSGIENGINISSELNALIDAFFQTEHRGSIPAKNKGDLSMYQLHRLRPEFCSDSEGIVPNADYYSALEERVDPCCPHTRSHLKKIENSISSCHVLG
jgi:class 3 adenylate cyclase